RHSRSGFVTGARLKKPGEPEAGVIYEASDNDGLWTALYVAAQSFRYAATKDPAARAAAKKSMRAMLDLVRYTGVPGFPARAIVPRQEVERGATGRRTDGRATVTRYVTATRGCWESRGRTPSRSSPT